MTEMQAPAGAGGIPNLGDVATRPDVSTKGTGSYAADYINWCRVTQMLRDHAPGWQFHLRTVEPGQYVWKAPNGTGYLIGFFTGPEGQVTADFPQAVMDNRNAPIVFEKITARDVTDTHRRAICTTAAATFGLGWQLWAKEPLEDPNQRDDEPAPRQQRNGKPQVTTEELVAAAREAMRQTELTADGYATLLLQFGDGSTKDISELPAAVLRSIPKLMKYPSKVALLNRGLHTATEQPLLATARQEQQTDEEPAEEVEDPATWSLTAAA